MHSENKDITLIYKYNVFSTGKAEAVMENVWHDIWYFVPAKGKIHYFKKIFISYLIITAGSSHDLLMM